MSELTKLSLHQIIQQLRNGDFSSRELTTEYLKRIKEIDPKINAFISVAYEQALDNSELADQKLIRWRKDHSNKLPLLTGIPIAVKDVLCVANMQCTCGSRILENFTPPYNATVIDRLITAGVIVIGKTNMDEFAMGSSTENSAFGITRNPWDLTRVPGGSSGGSAAAVAANLAPVALGTDTGGSIRQPAAFCGISGLKPTYGRVSRFGLVAYGSSLDVVGILGQNAVDLGLIFSLIAGVDSRDSTSVDLSVPELDFPSKFSGYADKRWTYKPNTKLPLDGLKIGIPEQYFTDGIQPDVEDAVKKGIKHLVSLGATPISVNLPHTKYAVPVYYIIAPAEASANLARYDGIRYGHRINSENILDVYLKTRGELFGSEVKRRIMLGTYALSAGYYEAYYGQAQKVRTLIKADFDHAFQNVDVIAAPVAPSTAFPIGEHRYDPLSMYLEDVFTLPANLAGIPGITFPVGFDHNKLPIGMQLMAPNFQEELLLNIIYRFQESTNWHKKKPVIS